MPFNLDTGEWEEEEPVEEDIPAEGQAQQVSIFDPVKEQGVLEGGLSLAGSMIPGAAAGYAARQSQTDNFSVGDIFNQLGKSDLPYYIPGVGEALGLKHAIQSNNQNTDAATNALSKLGYLGIVGLGVTGAGLGGYLAHSVGRQIRTNRGIADMRALPSRPISNQPQTMLSPQSHEAVNLFPSSVPSSRRSYMMDALHEVELAALEGKTTQGHVFDDLSKISATSTLEHVLAPIAEAFIRGVTGKTKRTTGVRRQEVNVDVIRPFMLAMGERYKELPAFRQGGGVGMSDLKRHPSPEFQLVEYIAREFSKFDYALENDIIRMVHPNKWKKIPGSSPPKGEVSSFVAADERLGPNRALPGLMHESPDVVIKAWEKISRGKSLTAREMMALSETMFSFAELTQQIAHPELILSNPLIKLKRVSISQYRFNDSPTKGQLEFSTLKFPRRPRGSEQIHYEVMNDLQELYTHNPDALISLMTENILRAFTDDEVATLRRLSQIEDKEKAFNWRETEHSWRHGLYDRGPGFGSEGYDASSQRALSTILWGFSSQVHPDIEIGTPMMAALENATKILGLEGPNALLKNIQSDFVKMATGGVSPERSVFWDRLSLSVSGELIQGLRRKARETFDPLFLEDINQPLQGDLQLFLKTKGVDVVGKLTESLDPWDSITAKILGDKRYWQDGVGPRQIFSTNILKIIQEPLPAGFISAGDKAITYLPEIVPVQSLRQTSFDDNWGMKPASRVQEINLLTDSEGNINIGGNGLTSRLLYSTVVPSTDGKSFVMRRKRPEQIAPSLTMEEFFEMLGDLTMGPTGQAGETGARIYSSQNKIPGLMEGEIIALSARADGPLSLTETGKPTAQQLLKLKRFLESEGIEFEAIIDNPHQGPTRVHVDELGQPVWDSTFAKEQGYGMGVTSEVRQQVILKFRTPEDLKKAFALMHSPETLLRSAATGWDEPSSHHARASHYSVLYNALYGSDLGLDDLPRRIRKYDVDENGMLVPVQHETDMKLAAVIARDYDALPEGVKHLTTEELQAWRQAEVEIHSQFHYLTEDPNGPQLKVEFVDYDPYSTNGQPDYKAMVKDVQENNTLKIMDTKVTGSHPLWTNETNNKFRAVHDYFGHAGLGNDFGRHGEDYAFAKHFHMFSRKAQKAIFVETKGQNSSLVINGEFAPQKVGFLKSFDEVLKPEFQKKWWVEADNSGQMTGPGATQGRVIDSLLGEDVLDLVIYSDQPVGGTRTAYEHHYQNESGSQHLVHNSMQGNVDSANTVPVQIVKGRHGLDHFFGSSNTPSYEKGFTNISTPSLEAAQSGRTVMTRGGLVDMAASEPGDSIIATGRTSPNPLFDSIQILPEGATTPVKPQAIVVGMGAARSQHPSMGSITPDQKLLQRKTFSYVAEARPDNLFGPEALHQAVIVKDGSGVIVELPVMKHSERGIAGEIRDIDFVNPTLATEIQQLLLSLGVSKVEFRAMDTKDAYRGFRL
mgnify:CR=1 FL=1